MIRPFLLALGFLTRLPVPMLPNLTPAEWGRSTLFYPVIGMLIGALLTITAGVCHALALHPPLQAAIILTVWVVLTGGLHLDGLADTADAWIGGLGDHARTLSILKDPRSGPAAIQAVTLLLLIKFAALQEPRVQDDPFLLLIPPLLGRSALLLLLATTPYIRPQGLGTPLLQHFPRRAALLTALASLTILPALWNSTGTAMALAFLLILGGMRFLFMRRLGGITGDLLGAACELLEACCLFCLVV
jgi:adenosylcobinamide-GDP ribazoletransferase